MKKAIVIGLVLSGLAHGAEGGKLAAPVSVIQPGVFLMLAGALEGIAYGYAATLNGYDKTDGRIITGLRLGSAGCLLVSGLLMIRVDF